MKVVSAANILLLLLGVVALPTNMIAQSEKVLPFKPKPGLNDQQRSGEFLFFQHCALCHLPKYRKSASTATPPVVWRNLEGVFKDTGPDREKEVREQILKGGLNMPGFQYGLQPAEIDDVIAYLKIF
jgi:mono/diheme cytochrome c family protein